MNLNSKFFMVTTTGKTWVSLTHFIYNPLADVASTLSTKGNLDNPPQCDEPYGSRKRWTNSTARLHPRGGLQKMSCAKQIISQ